MTPDEYLFSILHREAVDTGAYSPVRSVYTEIYPIVQRWAGNRLISVHPSGSFMKGTANKSGTDIDLFVSLSEQTTETLREIYQKLFDTMKANGYTPTRQNVSVNVRARGLGLLTAVPPADSASSPEVTRCSSVPCCPQTPWCGG